MKKIQYPSFLLLLLISTCCNRPEKDIGVKEISPEYFIDKPIFLSDFAEDISYIPLSEYTLIANIIDVKLTDSLIFVASNPNGILVYNWEGEYSRAIGRKGRGPGEYVRATNFTLDRYNKIVYVKGATKIISYNFAGDMIRQIRGGQTLDLSKLQYKEGKLYGFNPVFNTVGNNNFNWIEMDTLGNEIFIKPNTTNNFKTNGVTLNGNLTYRLNDNIYYWNHYNDTIFEIGTDYHTAKYIFKKDKFRLTTELAGLDEYVFGMHEVFVPRIILESQQFLFVQYRQNKEKHYCIYDKRKDVFIKTDFQDEKNEGISNDIDGGINFLPLGYDQVKQGEYLYTVLNAYEIRNYVNSNTFKNATPKYPEKKKELEQLANSLDENDNPVLMLVKLKK